MTARSIATLCGVLVVVGSIAPWAEGLTRMSGDPTTYLGVWRPEGQLTLAFGLVACIAACWRRPGSQHLRSDVAMALAFGVTMVQALTLRLDADRLRQLPGGAIPVEGWEWFEPRWGLTLVVVSSAAGLLASIIDAVNSPEGTLISPSLNPQKLFRSQA